MRLHLLIPLLAALVASPGWAATTDCPSHYVDGIAPDITNQRMEKNARELCFSAFGVMHSGITRTPLWSAEHLTRQSLNQARGMKRVDSFHEEDRLPANERSTLQDFFRSGYDRGHQFPNADASDKQSQYESFSMANMIPQSPENNRNLFAGIESAVRTMAMQRGDLYVITGPLFLGKNIKQLHGRVMVPTNIFKLVYDPQRNEAAAYLVANEEGNDYKVISVSELEQMAGINFFPEMDEARKTMKVTLPEPAMHGQGRGRTSASAPTPSGPSLMSILHLLSR